MTMRRRAFLKTAAAGAATVPLWRGKARAQAKPVRIGYAISATGPYAIGASITQAPNYTLWQEQVNARGGLAVKGEGRRPIEFVSTDDRSEIETAVRFYEKSGFVVVGTKTFRVGQELHDDFVMEQAL